MPLQRKPAAGRKRNAKPNAKPDKRKKPDAKPDAEPDDTKPPLEEIKRWKTSWLHTEGRHDWHGKLIGLQWDAVQGEVQERWEWNPSPRGDTGKGKGKGTGKDGKGKGGDK